MIKKLSFWLYRIASQSRPQIGFALLLFVLGIAVWLRTLAPGIPISDPDTWGYLYPALSELAGKGFQQTHGRGIAYPLFLLGVLGFTGSFFSIVVAQHSIGILSGLLWWAVFGSNALALFFLQHISGTPTQFLMKKLFGRKAFSHFWH